MSSRLILTKSNQIDLGPTLSHFSLKVGHISSPSWVLHLPIIQDKSGEPMTFSNIT